MSDTVKENAVLQDGDNAERKAEVLRNFERAWVYGLDNFDPNLGLDYLTGVAGKVEPDLCLPGRNYAEIRNQLRQFRGGYVPPADKQRVMVHLDRAIVAANAINMSPIERAVYDYFHLTRIQPFLNGNKRLSNIIMNARLNHSRLLPVSVSNKCVPDFEGYLIGAIDGFRESTSHCEPEDVDPYINPDFRQKQFYEFLGRKELCALRCAENQMAGLANYDLDLKCNSPAASHQLKTVLDSYFRARNLPHQIKIDARAGKIHIVGEMPVSTLQHFIEKTRGIRSSGLSINGHRLN